MALTFALVLAAPAVAQQPAPQSAAASNAVSTAELEKLVGTLQDEKQRARLVEELRGLIAAQRGVPAQQAPSPATVLSDLSQRIDAFSGEIVATAAVLVDAPRLVSWLERQVSEPEARAFWLDVALKLGVIFGFALFGEWLLRIVLRRPRQSLAGNGSAHVFARLLLVLARAVLDALPILTFAGIAYLVLPFTDPRFATAQVATTLVSAYVTTRIIVAVARIILLPRRGPSILHYFGEETRSYLYVWTKRFTYTAVWGYSIAAGSWWLGVPGSVYALLLKGTALVIAVLAVIFVLQNRAHVGDWLRGHDAPAAKSGGWRMLRQRLADTWHILAIIYIVGIFVVYALRVEGGFTYVFRGTVLSILVIIAARLVVNLVRRLSRRGFAIGNDLKTRFPTLEARANRYLPVLTIVVATLVYAFAILTILQAWSIDAFSWLNSDFGRHLTGSAVSIGAVILVALILWEFFSSAIERYLSAVDSNGMLVQRSARARTLLPLLRTSMLVLLIVLIALIVLSELGVDIGPLLAGAGVVGLAIGFGSQALVKDVITGLFILIEDQLAVGDVVDVGKGHSGVVEAISIRTIRLRDSAGAVHSVPFSEVTSISNMTRDYAYFVANVPISYREDVDRVAELLDQVAEGMRDDAEFRPAILAPLEFVGIDKMSELGVVVQARLKTLPRRQWAVGREFARRMKQSFDRNGIEMPYAFKPNYLGELASERSRRENPPKTRSA
ncbi:MAG TPA: mechanosensitive ion channel domain-containing protein [Stellaceae bacterium]|nr:mechanosensitive ion channel domain-containing protein [Stellaceae bacterium]